MGSFLAGWIPTHQLQGPGGGMEGHPKAETQNLIILPAEAPTLSLHTSRNRELTAYVQAQPLPSL